MTRRRKRSRVDRSGKPSKKHRRNASALPLKRHRLHATGWQLQVKDKVKEMLSRRESLPASVVARQPWVDGLNCIVDEINRICAEVLHMEPAVFKSFPLRWILRKKTPVESNKAISFTLECFSSRVYKPNKEKERKTVKTRRMATGDTVHGGFCGRRTKKPVFETDRCKGKMIIYARAEGWALMHYHPHDRQSCKDADASADTVTGVLANATVIHSLRPNDSLYGEISSMIQSGLSYATIINNLYARNNIRISRQLISAI